MSAVTRALITAVLLALVAFAACGAPSLPTRSSVGEKPTSVPRTTTPQPASDEEAVIQLVRNEGRAVVGKDTAALMDLWAPEATVVDAKHTPDKPEDDARWRGRDAIRERYVVLVFPGNPQTAAPQDLQITFDGDRATAVSTTSIGSEVSPGGDRWTFVKRDGRWWIESLTYNLEPAQ
jgi:ketosteroid isomerase-like protein